MRYPLIALFCLLSYLPLRAQDTTKVSNAADDLLAELADSTESQELLPERIMITQRAFWGKRGLFRAVGMAPLTAEGREKELKIRRTMLVSHQVLGFVTLAGMVAQGILGANLYNARGDRYTRIRNTHQDVATFINISYATTAVLSLTAPPPLVSRRKGFSSIKLHRALAIVHISGMIATNILARQIEKNFELKPYHRAAAFTTFASFGAAVIAIKF